ncbi:trehalose 6-phosphate synthase [Capronia epimyces CBS 606.96]|uniref:Trehalose 6-phosphate synthase n=1 Tax=Capronia epimyces CBS 606.96 TaxID=1182542 RepID=W9Y7E1_9EURO|nr:trehalose 6-phosphate synthase [Capronia epimyces CBS 606.96]EXJ85166.1 trehalose 6-phosphate synthase [Capronia epimyces CBS 606.96]
MTVLSKDPVQSLRQEYENNPPSSTAVETAPAQNPSLQRATTSYFSVPRRQPADQAAAPAAESPVDVAKGARSGKELLRRLSLVDHKDAEALIVDPRTAYPGLRLSGNVISATFCIPYQLSHGPNGEWALSNRRGTSALFDSFRHLSSDKTPWNHTLVGWTGEIQTQADAHTVSMLQNDATSTTAQSQAQALANTPINKSAAPYPVDGGTQHQQNQHGDSLWVSRSDRNRLEKTLAHHPNGKTVPVWLPDGPTDENGDFLFKDQSRWRSYAEHELYTLFHYRHHGPDDGRAEKTSWADYVTLNEAFADRILHVYQPGDIVWIHDYHLMLLPSLLRQRIPNIYLGFFLHIPFPSSEYMRCLPRRKDVLTGALGATMIGFQSYSFSRHFNSCCKRILGFESSSAGVDAYGAHVAVDVFPIGIDVGSVQKLAFLDPVIEQNMEALTQLYAGKKIIVGRDRLDTVRGVAQKLMAFEIFLERYPEWRDKVVLIQVTSPTSVMEEKVDGAHKVEHHISNLVSRINGKYGSLSHAPVQHYPQYLTSQEYFALLRVADVGLITSVRDGMNTTSLEYVICQKDHHGPLILSEFSGTAASLGNAIHINPWDLGGVAQALKYALEMPEEKKRSDHEKLYNYVTTHNVSSWSNNFLRRLLTNLTSFTQSDLTPALDRNRMIQQYQQAKKRLFMFDYDGTLTPIVKDPNAAIPSDRVLRTLKALAADPRNNVWIISGRDASFLEEWMGHITELGLSAEHGCFMRRPGSEQWENLAASMDMGWQKEVMDIFTHYTERTQGSWIEKKRVALTWHYRQADPDFGAFQARECRKALEDNVMKNWDVEVMSGKANLEVRPQFVNKGFIATRLINEYGFSGGDPPDFVLCLGDDQTDEDMFRALLKTNLPKDDIYACTVGASSKRTLATWHLLEPSDVIASLAALIKQENL